MVLGVPGAVVVGVVVGHGSPSQRGLEMVG